MRISRIAPLDGWRALSISLVLAGHLLPLGPKQFQLNEAIATAGMAVFFTLSGFLITGFLLKNSNVSEFLVRRFTRIVPLVWLFLAIVLPLKDVEANRWLPHILFYGNLPPFWLVGSTAHLWSVAMEMQFYLFVAVVVAVMGKRGLYVLPVLCVAVTVARVAAGAHISIVTWLRVDEILAGAMLALLYYNHSAKLTLPYGSGSRIVFWLLAVLFFMSCHPASGPLQYFRPYLAAALVGLTLLDPGSVAARALSSQRLVYLAQISFALYVVHPLLADTWLGTGDDKLIKYAKRPLLFLAIFFVAHLSTFYYEKWWISAGRRFGRQALKPVSNEN